MSFDQLPTHPSPTERLEPQQEALFAQTASELATTQNETEAEIAKQQNDKQEDLGYSDPVWQNLTEIEKRNLLLFDIPASRFTIPFGMILDEINTKTSVTRNDSNHVLGSQYNYILANYIHTFGNPSEFTLRTGFGNLNRAEVINNDAFTDIPPLMLLGLSLGSNSVGPLTPTPEDEAKQFEKVLNLMRQIATYDWGEYKRSHRDLVYLLNQQIVSRDELEGIHQFIVTNTGVTDDVSDSDDKKKRYAAYSSNHPVFNIATIHQITQSPYRESYVEYTQTYPMINLTYQSSNILSTDFLPSAYHNLPILRLAEAQTTEGETPNWEKIRADYENTIFNATLKTRSSFDTIFLIQSNDPTYHNYVSQVLYGTGDEGNQNENIQRLHNQMATSIINDIRETINTSEGKTIAVHLDLFALPDGTLYNPGTDNTEQDRTKEQVEQLIALHSSYPDQLELTITSGNPAYDMIAGIPISIDKHNDTQDNLYRELVYLGYSYPITEGYIPKIYTEREGEREETILDNEGELYVNNETTIEYNLDDIKNNPNEMIDHIRNLENNGYLTYDETTDVLTIFGLVPYADQNNDLIITPAETAIFLIQERNQRDRADTE